TGRWDIGRTSIAHHPGGGGAHTATEAGREMEADRGPERNAGLSLLPDGARLEVGRPVQHSASPVVFHGHRSARQRGWQRPADDQLTGAKPVHYARLAGWGNASPADCL